MKISFIQNFIDILRGKKELEFITQIKIKKAHKNYKKILLKLQDKIARGEKIKVGFLVVYDSVFSAENIFKKMLEDDIFDPFILVIPDVCRGDENMFYQMKKTYKTLSLKHENVYNSYDYDKNAFIDWSNKMDMCFFANPYDALTNNLYSIEYLKNKVLTLHVPYSYTGFLNYNLNIYKSNEYASFWKIFVENENVLNLIKENKQNNYNNLKIIGYPKMDNIANIKNVNTEKPLIVITPHHTIQRIPNYLNISQFLKFSDFFLELPIKYPNIDFIFRPHSLLFVTLANEELWGKERIEKYIEAVKSIPNMEYQEGGDYFETFAKSTALINDCGSFLAEYFYFNKPQCFLLENQDEIEQEFTSAGKEILNNLYQAYDEKDIENFINEVVLQKNDYLNNARNQFAKEKIIINHPKASSCLIDYIKSELENE